MIIGKPFLLGGIAGMLPEIIVTAPAGSTLDVMQNSVVLQTYTLGASETTHTFKLTELGNYSVRGTLGTQTKTETVYVDEVTQFSVSISYALYLYNLGDERESVTGGWRLVSTTYSTGSGGDKHDGVPSGSTRTITKNAASIAIQSQRTSTIGYTSACTLMCPNTIDLTNYSKLKIDFNAYAYISSDNETGYAFLVYIDAGTPEGALLGSSCTYLKNYSTAGTFNEDLEKEVDISSYSGSYYIAPFVRHYRSTGTIKMTINKIWLE